MEFLSAVLKLIIYVSNRWVPDDLAAPAFADLGNLKVVPVVDYDSRFDMWWIEADLSSDCMATLIEENDEELSDIIFTV